MKLLLMVFLVMIISTGIAVSQPQLEISPDPLQFGFISVGGSQIRNISLTNTGDQTLVLDSCYFQSPFNIDYEEGVTIDPGETLEISTSFMPSAETYYSDSFIFYCNIPDSEYELAVTANGIRGFQPGEIIWSFQHIENVVCVAASDDCNGDGLPDVVAEGYDAGADGDPLVCLSGSGCINPEIIWSVHPSGGPSNSGGYGDQCLKYAGDLNGDSHSDILRGGAWGSRTVFAIDGMTGSTIWSHDTYQFPPSGWIYTVNQIDDVTGDDVPDVLAGAGSDCDKAFCFNGTNGDIIWQYQAEDAVSSICMLSDINEDGYNEAVFGVMDNGQFIYCISGASQGVGTILWTFNINESVFSVSAINDIDDDGYDDVIAGTWGRGVMAFSGHRFGNGIIVWENPLSTYVMKVVSCSDLNSDGYSDILVASWDNSAYALSGVDGSQIWSCYCGDDVWAIDYIEDISGDGVDDVIAGSFTHNVYAIDGVSGEQIWQCHVRAKPFSVRGIGDVNGDGFNDVIAGTQLLHGSGGEVFVISGGETQTSIEEQQTIIPENFITVSNYPNPFNSSTVVSFSLDKATDYMLSIYDVNGRLVDQLSGSGHAGPNCITWNPDADKHVVSGMYVYRIEAGKKFGQSKMLYLK